MRISRIGTPSDSRFCSTFNHWQRQELRYQVLDQFGGDLAEIVQQLLHLVVAEQFVRVALQDLAEMGGDHGAGVDHRVTQGLGMIALGGVDPDRLESEGRILGLPCPAVRRRHCPG